MSYSISRAIGKTGSGDAHEVFEHLLSHSECSVSVGCALVASVKIS